MENSIYLHIPFCVRKCDYCDFLSFPGALCPDDIKAAYVDALIREIKLTPKALGSISTVYIGGGTPSLLDPSFMDRIMTVLYEEYDISHDAEISMEVNPGTVDMEKLGIYRRLGINRLSMGVQSFDDRELKLLGRIHDSSDAKRCYADARKAGFTNVNIDLMMHIPGQSTGSLKKTLEVVRQLAPEHLSCYSLIIEEGTPFYDRYPERPMDEDTEAKMDVLMREELKAMGYGRYEISNWALEGFECRHNLGCWHRDPYKGYGLGAASLYRDIDGNEYRFTGERDLQVYITKMQTLNPGDDPDMGEPLTQKDRMEEFMFLGLRCIKGISSREFENVFKKSMEEVYGAVLDRYLAMDFLEKDGDRYFFTSKGIDVSNVILADFLL
ncbi:MAG: radical SAM family heme chaperone HemW [Lachnospiraceae bacterium]|nr:radical SAM family heme chaperone HemW [Lachnospiraceae bacterium]